MRIPPLSSCGVIGGQRRRVGFLLIEALVYIGLVVLVLGGAYIAVDRTIEHSLVIHRTAEDIARVMNVGESWREDVRTAQGEIQLAITGDEQLFRVPAQAGEVRYRFAGGALFRQRGGGPEVCLLSNVGVSSMVKDLRSGVVAWRWELELQPRAKGTVKPARVRPLFTFIAVPRQGQPK